MIFSSRAAEHVAKFTAKFKLPVIESQAKPNQFTLEAFSAMRETLVARLKHKESELAELRAAIEAGDPVEVADALADLVYLCYGTAHAAGIPLDAVLTEVHNSNMKKVRRTVDDGEMKQGISKPEGWRPPDVAGVLKMFGWRL